MRRGSVYQLDGLPATPTQNLPRERWLELRRAGIGGSDIAGILGISPWSTPLAVYCAKAGLTPDRDPTEAMEFGIRMEPTLRKWAQAELRTAYGDGRTVLSSPYLYQHPYEPRYLGNVDGVVLLDGQPIAGLEIKTVDRYAAKEWRDGALPAYYRAQAQWYMGVTGLPVWYIAALIGKRFELRTVVQDRTEIERMQAAADAFWEDYVAPRRMPEAEPNDSDLLLNLYGLSGEDILYDEDMATACAAYLERKAEVKLHEAEAEKWKVLLEQRIGEAKGLQAGKYRAVWSRYTTNRVDTGALREGYPDVYTAVVKESRSGRLVVKEGEEE